VRTLARVTLLLAIASVAMVVVTASASAAQTTSQYIYGGGSDTTEWMMQGLGDLYANAPGCNQLHSPQPLDGSCPNSATENPANFTNYFHDVPVERYFVGSSGGVNALCQTGTSGVSLVNFARSSRVPLPASAGGSDCSGLHFVGYARDGITWECFPTVSGSGCKSLVSGTNSLTTVQLKDIFVNCTVTNWDQIGGSNVPIDVYVPQANSGSGITWAAALGVTLAAGQTLDQCIPSPFNTNPGQPGSHISPENTNSLIVTNGDQANAIFPYSVGVYHHTYGLTAFSCPLPSSNPVCDGSSLGAINGKKPTNTLILDGKFPVGRYLFNVYCAASGGCGTANVAPADVTNFVGEQGFICQDESAFPSGAGGQDPFTGKPYRSAPVSGKPAGEIPTMITNFGFVPLNKQSDGTYCVTFTT